MTETKNRPLTNKQKAFVQEYTSNGFNATMAALAAGYTGNSNALAVRGSELVRNRKVKTEIERIQARTAKECKGMREVIGDELSEHRELAVEKSDIASANSASLGRAKLFGLLVERTEHTIRTSGPPVDRLERIAWHKAQLEQLEAAEQEGTALAIEYNVQ